MTSLPETVFAEVLEAHRPRGATSIRCICGWTSPRAFPRPKITQHQAERLAARFKQVGWYFESEFCHELTLTPQQTQDVPVFRLIPRESETP